MAQNPRATRCGASGRAIRGPVSGFRSSNIPSAHRVHHASNLQYIDKNYGGVLLIWDLLFGSYQAERSDIPIRYTAWRTRARRPTIRSLSPGVVADPKGSFNRGKCSPVLRRVMGGRRRRMHDA